MGKAALGVCFSDLADAAAHVCGHAYPVGSATGSVTSCTGSSTSGGSAVLSVTVVSGTGSTSSNLTFALPDCDPLTFTSGPWPGGISAADAALVGTAVVGVWLIGAAWVYIRRALGDHNDGRE